jgi:spore germination cell wall hydrolase CwlJ-like protein
VAVAHVIFNRAAARKKSVHDVVFASKQFSCYNGGRRPPIRDYGSFIKCVQAVDMALAQRLMGKTLGGAQYYLNERLTLKLYGKIPNWVKRKKLVEVIGNHSFYA